MHFIFRFACVPAIPSLCRTLGRAQIRAKPKKRRLSCRRSNLRAATKRKKLFVQERLLQSFTEIRYHSICAEWILALLSMLTIWVPALRSLFLSETTRGHRHGSNVVNKLTTSGWASFIKRCVMLSVTPSKKTSTSSIGVAGHEIERKICFVDVS